MEELIRFHYVRGTELDLRPLAALMEALAARTGEGRLSADLGLLPTNLQMLAERSFWRLRLAAGEVQPEEWLRIVRSEEVVLKDLRSVYTRCDLSLFELAWREAAARHPEQAEKLAERRSRLLRMVGAERPTSP